MKNFCQIAESNGLRLLIDLTENLFFHSGKIVGQDHVDDSFALDDRTGLQLFNDPYGQSTIHINGRMYVIEKVLFSQDGMSVFYVAQLAKFLLKVDYRYLQLAGNPLDSSFDFVNRTQGTNVFIQGPRKGKLRICVAIGCKIGLP